VSEAPLRFAVVIQTPKDEQSAVYIGYHSLASSLRKQQHSMTIVAPSDFPALARLGGRWTPFVYPLAIASWLRKRRGEFDLVMFHSYSGWLATVLTGGRPSTMVMFHGVEPLYHRELRAETERAGGRLSWRYRLLQEVFMPLFLTIACRSANAVACLNGAEAAYLKSRRWASDRNLHVLAHGVGENFFIAKRERREMQTLLFVGQWLPMKGIRYLREAASALLEDGRLRLVCAGTLADEDRVKSEFPAALHAHIRVMPRVDQSTLAQLYREADAFIFPSLYEGFSRAIVEAMSSRLPIVCTSVGVAADALRHEESALIVPSHDAPAMVAAVRRLQSDPSFAQRLGDRAAEAARPYAFDGIAARTIDVLVKVARASP
jgi:glycosyltransferase involved in cell wall biosynthesis